MAPHVETTTVQAAGEHKKTRIAVLGGGVGALTAAFELTSPSNPRRDQYEVTVFQMGWRLGGKGASGRNARRAARIEEHGLHIWFGFYENAFRLMREAYAELGRPAEGPLATWREAFTPLGLVTLEELHDNTWKRWNLYFPETDEEPGEGGVLPSLWATAQTTVGWIVEAFGRSRGEGRSWFVRLLIGLWEMLRGELATVRVLRDLHTLLDGRASAASRPEHDRLHQDLRAARDNFLSEAVRHISDRDTARRFLIVADLGLTTIAGLLSDRVIGGDTNFNDLDREEFKAWLTRHGARPETVRSRVVRSVYDAAFAYRHGEPSEEAMNMGAGTALRAGLRIAATYKGGVMWKMHAGMGDTVFTPLYKVLKRRGVKFRFFHKVEDLIPDSAGRLVEQIRLARQVDLKDPEYRPLVDVKGLECWPSEPQYEQIVQGEALRRGPPPHNAPYNLESHWCTWEPVERLTLNRGQDFDQVVLGISLAALPDVAESVVAIDRRWQRMLAKIETVQTQAFQLWLHPSVAELGWKPAAIPGMKAPQRPIINGYVNPFNTWCDMSQLVPRENWPADGAPQSIAYFCGAKETTPLPAAPNDAVPLQQNTLVKRTAIDWLTANTGTLWPKGALSGDTRCLNWSLLVDGEQRHGAERFEAQYWRANIDPTERYVQSVADTVQFRLKADDSGFGNLVLAGDWTLNGINLGCVEAAAMSGMQASRALSDYPQRIVGDPQDTEWL